MTKAPVTLGDLLRFLVAKLASESIKLPLQDERSWRRVFYSLKKEQGEKYDFLRKLRFDWDGPAPRSKELAEYIHALHWTGNTSAYNPSWEAMTLPSDITGEWLHELDDAEPEIKALIGLAFDKAKAAFAN